MKMSEKRRKTVKEKVLPLLGIEHGSRQSKETKKITATARGIELGSSRVPLQRFVTMPLRYF